MPSGSTGRWVHSMIGCWRPTVSAILGAERRRKDAMAGHVSRREIRIGLVAALPVESAAIRLVLDDVTPLQVRGDPNLYQLATVPSGSPGRPHRVVAAMQSDDGNRNASAVCTDLARSFPDLEHVLM